MSVEPSGAATAGSRRAAIGTAMRVPWMLDGFVGLAIFGASVAVFAADAGRLGFYSDDAGFLTSLPHDGFSATLQAARDYVPGRNLHIIWQQLLFVIGGDRPVDLGTLHVLQSLLDGVTVVLFFVLLRALTLPLVWALLGTALFAFYPNHGETHYWLSAGPMNIVSTLFLLAFAITAVSAIRRSVGTRAAPSVRVLALEVLFFGLAMFTYDQTFFCLLLVCAVQAGHLVWARIRPTRATILAGGAVLVLALLDIHLKQNPVSGPTLAHASLHHVLDNVRLSFSLTWGPIFKAQLQSLVNGATRGDKVAALACAVGLVAIVGALIVRDGVRDRRAHGSERLGPEAVRCAGLAVAGVAAFFLGYLPADAWYISPRHNFLPTAGFVLALVATGALASVILRHRVHWLASAALAVVFAGVAAHEVFRFVEAGLVEKSYWEAAYQPRALLYRSLMAKHLVAGKTAIVFQNFPATLGPAPFFAQENENALRYLYPHRVSLTKSAISALETPQGYYLGNEIDRYGIASMYLPERSVLDVVYRAERHGTIVYTLGDRRYETSRFYSVRRSAVPSHVAGLRPIRRAVVTAGRGPPILHLVLSLRHVHVPAQKELGVLLSQGGRPLTDHNPYGERMLVPIGLLAGPAGGGNLVAFDVVLKDPVLRPVDTVSLYTFGEQSPRLVQTASVTR